MVNDGCGLARWVRNELRAAFYCETCAYRQAVFLAGSRRRYMEGGCLRDEGAGGGGCDYGFYVDGKLVARMATSEATTFHVPSGEHLVGVGRPSGAILCFFGLDKPREVETVVRSCQTKTFRLGHSGDIAPTVSPVSIP